jgi:large subunit ribosomal protein L23
MSTVYEIIRKQLRTEKSELATERGQYTFEVSLDATKGAIRDAVQELCGVNVVSVNTMRVAGKRKRFGRTFGKRSNWKKAIVTLRDGESISFSAATTTDAEEVDE